MRLPRLMDAGLHPLGLLHPTSLSISLKLSPLSTASMVLPPDASIQVGQFVELFTQQGSAGIFRVEQVERSWQKSLRVSLSHGLITLGDSLFFADDEQSVTLPATQLFQDILSRQSYWVPGQIDLPQEQLVTWQGRSASLLEALQALLAALPTHCLTFNQAVFPWVVNLIPMPQDSLSECRLTRNLRSLTIETDRSQLCTQLHLPGLAEPLQADTIAQWGVVARCMDADGDLPQEEVLLRGQQYLEQHKNPTVTIQMEALELSRLTGCSLDSFRLGAPCRICLPEERTCLTHRIVSLTWPDVYATPQLLSITLANQAKNTASLLAGLIVDTTQVKHQVVRQWNALGNQKKLLIAADESIDILSRSINLHAQDILTLQAGVADNAAKIVLHDGRIDATAKAINLRATQADVDALGARLSQAEIDIDGAEATIKLKANQTDVDTQGQRLSSAEIAIDGANAAIKLKADKTTVDDQGKRLSQAEIDIDGTNAAIALKADKTTVDDQGKRLSQAEIDIDGANAAIALKADKTTVDDQGKRLSSAEIAIDGANAAIALKADKTTVDDQGKRLSQAEIDIDGANAAIALKASQTSVDDLTGRVSSAEASIKVNADSIVSKVSKDGIISAINQTAESVRISAGKIDLDGYVTIKDMEADFATLLDGFADEFSTTDLYASTITLGQSLSAPDGYLSANTIAASASMTVDGAEVATQSWSDSRYYTRTYCNANFATFTHLSTNYALQSSLSDYQLASGLTTQTVTVVTGVSATTATTPPFYNASGTKVNNGVDYVKSISKSTKDITFVVYA